LSRLRVSPVTGDWRSDLDLTAGLLNKVFSSARFAGTDFVESGNEEILRKVKKSTNLAKVRRDFALCRAMGVKTHAHCMLGMPGETRPAIGRPQRRKMNRDK